MKYRCPGCGLCNEKVLDAIAFVRPERRREQGSLDLDPARSVLRTARTCRLVGGVAVRAIADDKLESCLAATLLAFNVFDGESGSRGMPVSPRAPSR